MRPPPYPSTVVQNGHLETLHLRALEKSNAPFDVAFFASLRQREIKVQDRANRPEGGA